MPRHRLARLAAVAALAALCGCGADPFEQGLFGAGAGTGVALLSGTDPVTGALVGGLGNLAYCTVYEGNCR